MKDGHGRGGDPSKGRVLRVKVKSPLSGTQAIGCSWSLLPTGMALLDHWTISSPRGQKPHYHSASPQSGRGTDVEQDIKDTCLMKEEISLHLST